MKKHPFFYLGFLSLLSLIYFITDHTGVLGFLGFLGYFSIYKQNDERLNSLIGQACINGFLFSILTGSLCLSYMLISKNIEFAPLAFTIIFSGNILITLISYFTLERK